MRLIKMLGLAMVAAVAAMALAGASTASAASTTLCKVNELPCITGNQYSGSIVGKSTSATLLSNLGSVKCTGSEVKGETEGASLAEPRKGKITSVAFTGCTLNGSKCTVKAEGLNYAASVKVTPGTMNGIMSVTNPSAHISECLNCTFGFSSVELDVTGGKPATIVAKEEKLTREEGIFCPGEAKWDATYSVSTPAELWVAE